MKMTGLEAQNKKERDLESIAAIRETVNGDFVYLLGVERSQAQRSSGSALLFTYGVKN